MEGFLAASGASSEWPSVAGLLLRNLFYGTTAEIYTYTYLSIIYLPTYLSIYLSVYLYIVSNMVSLQ